MQIDAQRWSVVGISLGREKLASWANRMLEGRYFNSENWRRWWVEAGRSRKPGPDPPKAARQQQEDESITPTCGYRTTLQVQLIKKRRRKEKQTEPKPRRGRELCRCRLLSMPRNPVRHSSTVTLTESPPLGRFGQAVGCKLYWGFCRWF